MPYILSAPVTLELPGLFGEGNPYTKSTVIDILANDPKLPPVNYGAHLLKPHSLPHVDAPGHILPHGSTVEQYFTEDRLRTLFGPVVVVRLPGDSWQQVDQTTRCWRISLLELQAELKKVTADSQPPDRLIIAPLNIPLNDFGWHDPLSAFVLTEEAAEWLVKKPSFCTFGTSWRTSDFQPGSRERPVHKILLRQAAIFECLDLRNVPTGKYFLSAFPLRLEGATESPVCPVLFSEAELVGN